MNIQDNKTEKDYPVPKTKKPKPIPKIEIPSRYSKPVKKK